MITLDRILEPGALRVEFQPVFDLDSPGPAVHYHEGLVRGPRGSNVERPDVLFDYARRKHAEVEVDRAAMRTVLHGAMPLAPHSIGLNVHVATLATDLEFLTFLGELLRETGTAPDRVVMELVEHGQAWDIHVLRLALDGLREIGVRIALDDFGVGQSNLLMLLECRPQYVKLDRSIVHGCGVDAARRSVITTLYTLTARLGSRLVAEGVEDDLDLETARAAGAHLVQGYHLGRPAPAPRP